jgi:hypothetical protein
MAKYKAERKGRKVHVKLPRSNDSLAKLPGAGNYQL